MKDSITSRNLGFTLVELIMVIVIVGIVSVIIGPLIGGKYAAVADSQTRARLVQDAEFALFHLRQDLKRSVPQAVRFRDIAGINNLEFLGLDINLGTHAARYRDVPHPGPPVGLQEFNSGAPLANFDVMGVLNPAGLAASIGLADTNGDGNLTADDKFSDWNNRATDGTSTIATVGVATPRTGAANCDDIDNNGNGNNCNANPVTNIALAAGLTRTFPVSSPRHRVYFTNGPVRYNCNGGFMERILGGVTHRVVGNVAGCTFALTTGTPQIPPTLTVAITLTDNGESVRLVDVIALNNGF